LKDGASSREGRDRELGRDPEDSIKFRLDADPVPDFSPKPIIKIDILQILKLILKRWL
jgi:hypothetical protein